MAAFFGQPSWRYVGSSGLNKAKQTLSKAGSVVASHLRLEATGECARQSRECGACVDGIKSDSVWRGLRIALLHRPSTLALRRISLSNNYYLTTNLAAAALFAAALAGCGGGGNAQPGGDTVVGANASVGGPASGSVSGAAALTDSAALSCGLNQPNGIKQEMLERVNQLRSGGAMCGGAAYPLAPALSWNAELLQAAASHSADMATHNYFSHTSLDGRTPAQRLKQPGYDYSSMGENIAAGQISVEAVVNAWVTSPDHCKNLMNPVFRDMAVACVANSATTYGRYWTMELGREF